MTTSCRQLVLYPPSLSSATEIRRKPKTLTNRVQDHDFDDRRSSVQQVARHLGGDELGCRPVGSPLCTVRER